EEYQQFFNQTRSLLLIAGVDGYTKKVNPAYEIVSGYSAKSLMAVPFTAFIHPDDRELAVLEIQQGLEQTYLHDLHRRICSPDRSIRHLRLDCTTSLDNQYFYVVGEDVTEQLEFEKTLAELDRFARSTLDALSCHIAILDERGVI